MASEIIRLHEDVEEAVRAHNLCRNRLWALGSRLPTWSTRLRDDLRQFLTEYHGDLQKAVAHEEHSLCTYDFCEFSIRNFTAVKQLHLFKPNEGASIERHANSLACMPMKYSFPDRLLNNAVQNGHLTAWHLDGKTLLPHPEPFMAVSHVWSDGTGAGQTGPVHECLFLYFKRLAERLQCQGLWWDTICVPKDKALRSKALKKIDINYRYARVTLVHDTYLRNLPFKNHETACFAIVSSSWFTRAWTALELALSQKVRVVFSDSVLDLDEDILRHAGGAPAAEMIRQLRKGGLSSLQDLLDTLGPRKISKANDRGIIAGLLTGVPLSQSIDGDIFQGTIYQEILKKLGRVAYGHLFHGAPTMTEGFTWCPTDLFRMPRDASSPDLSVDEQGEVHGLWTVLAPVNETDCIWGVSDMLVEAKVRVALTDSPNKHVILVVPPSRRRDPAHRGRGLVVEVFRVGSAFKCQYVGALRFQQEMTEDTRRTKEFEVCIGDPATNSHSRRLGQYESAWNVLESYPFKLGDLAKPESGDLDTIQGSDWPLVHHCAWTGVSINVNDNWASLNQTDSLSRRAIHLAAERGNSAMVAFLLQGKVDPNCADSVGKRPLHYAALSGSKATVLVLLLHGAKGNLRDDESNLPLHIAAYSGHYGLACEPGLLRGKRGKRGLSVQGRNGLTPLHFAILGEHTRVVDWLVANGANIEARSTVGHLTPLHCAVSFGHEEMVKTLLETRRGKVTKIVMARTSIGLWTASHLAAISGNSLIQQMLVDRGGDMTAQDERGWTAQTFAQFAGINPAMKSDYPGVGHERGRENIRHLRWTRAHLALVNDLRQTTRTLLLGTENDGKRLKYPVAKHTEMAQAARFGYVTTLLLLLATGAWEVDLHTRHVRGKLWTALHHSAFRGDEKAVQALISHGADVTLGADDVSDHFDEDSDDDDLDFYKRPIHLAAKSGHTGVVHLLLNAGSLDDIGDEDGAIDILQLAANAGHEEVVDLLVDLRIDTKSEGDTESRLLAVARSGFEKSVGKLLQRHAAARLDDEVVIGAAMIAARKSHVGVIKQLFTYRTDLMKEAGPWLIDVAAAHGHSAIIDMLLSEGVHVENSHGNNAFLNAVRLGHGEIARVLLQMGVRKNNALHSAVLGGHANLTEWLLAEGADINELDVEGKTALHIAAKCGNSSLIRTLKDHGAVAETHGTRPWLDKSSLGDRRRQNANGYQRHCHMGLTMKKLTLGIATGRVMTGNMTMTMTMAMTGKMTMTMTMRTITFRKTNLR